MKGKAVAVQADMGFSLTTLEQMVALMEAALKVHDAQLERALFDLKSSPWSPWSKP